MKPKDSACIICGATASLHEHHIIPRCYGGENGPTATLCATCHNAVHNVADGIVDAEPLSWVHQHSAQTARKLINTILTARAATESSSNRRVTMTMTLTSAEAASLDRIKASMGLTSRDATIRALINRYFGTT